MRLVKLMVTFFFIGNIKIAPGTFASLATVVLFYIFAKNLDVFSFVLIILGGTMLSFIVVYNYTTDLLEKDKSEIVIDEVIGQSISLLPLLIFSKNTFPELHLCFISLLLFRFFDIVKPYPINKFDKINTPFGVIFDDILAGVFSAVLLLLILIF